MHAFPNNPGFSWLVIFYSPASPPYQVTLACGAGSANGGFNGKSKSFATLKREKARVVKKRIGAKAVRWDGTAGLLLLCTKPVDTTVKPVQ
jgi:hypothetical protein